MRKISSTEELKSLVGQQVSASDWVEVSQQRIDQFADATGDQQWIHVDVARCQVESPFGTTVAHGFLTLSLLPMLLQQAVAVEEVRMVVNYGLNKVRFPAALPAGSRVRGVFLLHAADDVEGGMQIVWEITVEVESGGKPVCVAELVTRSYF